MRCLLQFEVAMARPAKETCRLCSKLTPQEARLKHGAEGDGCWDDKHCHNRRSYYLNRPVRNYNRKQRRHQQQVQQQSALDLNSQVVTLDIPTPAIPAVIAHWYRETKNSPLHALGAELWIGNHRVAKIQPVHCLGLTEIQIKTLLLRILDGFSNHCGLKVDRFRSSVELHPLNCPLRPCSLHPDE